MITPGPWAIEAQRLEPGRITVAPPSPSHNRGCIIAACYGPDAEANAAAIAELGSPDLEAAAKRVFAELHVSDADKLLGCDIDVHWQANSRTLRHSCRRAAAAVLHVAAPPLEPYTEESKR